jgi:hypothetical protein
MVGIGGVSYPLCRRRHAGRPCVSTRDSGMVPGPQQTILDTAFMALWTSLDRTLCLDGNRSLARLENRECENSAHPVLRPAAAELRLVHIVLRRTFTGAWPHRRYRHVARNRCHHLRFRIQVENSSLPDGALSLLGQFRRCIERCDIHAELNAHNTRNATPRLGVVAASPGIDM